MGYNYLIELKTLLEKEKLLVTSNFFFSHNVFKSCLLLMRQNEYLWSKGLNHELAIKLGRDTHIPVEQKSCNNCLTVFNTSVVDRKFHTFFSLS